MNIVRSDLKFQRNNVLFITAVISMIAVSYYAYINPKIVLPLAGSLGGILCSVRWLPQVYRSMITTKETKSLSLLFMIITCIQAHFLVLYGITKPDYLIAAMNVLPFLCTGLLIYLKLFQKNAESLESDSKQII